MTTRFEILGRVAARQDARAADLAPQQQCLLAVLVMAGGTVVGRRRLQEALWGFKERRRLPPARHAGAGGRPALPQQNFHRRVCERPGAP